MALAVAALTHRQTTPRSHDVDVALPDGRRLTGTVGPVYDGRLVEVGFSRLGGKQLLQAWVRLLALAAHDPDKHWTALVVGRAARGTTVAQRLLGPADHAPDVLLRDLVDLYDRGRREPLPLPVKTSYAWASAVHQGDDPLQAAERRWKSSLYPGENAAARPRPGLGPARAALGPPRRGASRRGRPGPAPPPRGPVAPAVGPAPARREEPVMATSTTPFDLTGALPATGTTTVLEASAGTGKTFALAGLVTRYVAEGHARLDDMLLITFGRAASQELRERVRGAARRGGRRARRPRRGSPTTTRCSATWPRRRPSELALRRGRLRDALASFDSATIATTHQFCQLVLRSLGVAGDSEAGADPGREPRRPGVRGRRRPLPRPLPAGPRDSPPFTRAEAGALSRDVVANPHTTLTPEHPDPGTAAAARVGFATEVLRELERRKRRLGVLGFDDLLSRLAQALADDDAPARQRMRDRWSIVMVDEFQDTDPVQWDVLHRAFDGASTLVLIGDPKQAIYAFRGGDIATYLTAAEGRDVRTLDTNWRSDQPARRGHPRGAPRRQPRRRPDPWSATSTPTTPAHRLAGAPHNDPFRLRLVTRQQCGVPPHRTVGIDRLRDHISADLAADVKALLASDATYDGRPVAAGDIAVIVEAHKDARACRDALAAAGVPAVYTGDTDVFSSRAAADWLCLLEAFEQPQRSGLVRAAATTMFFGESAASLAAGGDELTDRVVPHAAGVGRPRPRARGGGRARGGAGRRDGRPGAGLAGRRAPPHRPRPPRRRCSTRPPTGSGSAPRPCSTGCATRPPSGAGPASATGASTATPRPSRS